MTLRGGVTLETARGVGDAHGNGDERAYRYCNLYLHKVNKAD